MQDAYPSVLDGHEGHTPGAALRGRRGACPQFAAWPPIWVPRKMGIKFLYNYNSHCFRETVQIGTFRC